MTRRLTYLLAAITGASAVVRVWGLGRQALTLDELLMLPTAHHYMRFGVPRPEMPFHPNLRNILLDFSGRLLGSSAAGLKGWSVLFGVLSVLLLGLLIWRLTRSEIATLVAASLLAFDPLSIYMSRSALQDGWTVFFALAGLHLALNVIETESLPGVVRSSLFCGIAFGLGVSSKFYVIPIEGAAIAYLVVVLWRQNRRPLAVWVSSTVLLTSVFVFTLTYYPWFRAGHSASEWFAYLGALMQSIATHSIQITDNADTHAWQWFVRPFVAWQELQYAVPLPRMGIAVANPVSWLAVLASAVVVFVARRKRKGDAILLGLFLASYVPLLVAGRPIWVLSAVSVLPFAFALVGLTVDEVAHRFGGTRTAIAYVVAVSLVSAALFPGVTGDALKIGYLRQAVRRAAGNAPMLEPIERQLR